jgi:hypothetical protein
MEDKTILIYCYLQMLCMGPTILGLNYMDNA